MRFDNELSRTAFFIIETEAFFSKLPLPISHGLQLQELLTKLELQSHHLSQSYYDVQADSELISFERIFP